MTAPVIPPLWLPEVWRARLPEATTPEARAFLVRLHQVRSFTQSFQNLPRLPLGVVRVGLDSVASPEGLPILDAGRALSRLGASLRTEGSHLLALTGVLTQETGSLPQFLGDAVEDLSEAAAELGLPWRGRMTVAGEGEGMRLALLVLGTPLGEVSESWDPEAGDALVPLKPGQLPPEGSVAQVPLEGRPWWDVVLERVQMAGLGLALLEGMGERGSGLAVLRGGTSRGAWAHVLPEADLVLPPDMGGARLPLSAWHIPPEPPPRELMESPQVPAPEGRWEAALARALAGKDTPRPVSSGLVRLPEGAGEAEMVALPEGDSHLAWALEPAGDGWPGDPYWSAAGAVAALGTRLACVGAKPLGLVVHLQGEAVGAARWEAASMGLRQACLALDLPVGGLAWQEGGGGLSAHLLALGTVEDPAPPLDLGAPDATALARIGNRCTGSAFRAPFDAVVLLGGGEGDPRLDEALRLQVCVREGVRLGLLRSALLVERDGLLVAAARGALGGGLGCHLFVTGPQALVQGAGGVLATLGADGEEALLALCETHGVSVRKLGITGGAHLTVTQGEQPGMALSLEELRAMVGSH